MKFTFDGKSYSIDEVQEAAVQSNMSVEDYIKQVGLEEEEEPAFQVPTSPGVPVEGTATTPDMDLASGGTSLDSQDPNKKKKILSMQQAVQARKEQLRLNKQIKLDPTLNPYLNEDQKNQILNTRKNYESKSKVLFEQNYFQIAENIGLDYMNEYQLLTDDKFIQEYKKYVFDNNEIEIDNEYQRDKAFGRVLSTLQSKAYDTEYRNKIEQFEDELDDDLLLKENRKKGKNDFFQNNEWARELFVVNEDLKQLPNTFENIDKRKQLENRAKNLAESVGITGEDKFLFKLTPEGVSRADIGEKEGPELKIEDLTELYKYYANEFNNDKIEGEKRGDYDVLKHNLDLVYLEKNDLIKQENKKFDILFTGASSLSFNLNRKGYELIQGEDGRRYYKDVSVKDMVDLAELQSGDHIFKPYYADAPKEEGEIRVADFENYVKQLSETRQDLAVKQDLLEKMYYTNINPAGVEQDFANEFNKGLGEFILGSEAFRKYDGLKRNGATYQQDIVEMVNLMNDMGLQVTPEQMDNTVASLEAMIGQGLGSVVPLAIEFAIANYVTGGAASLLGIQNRMQKLSKITYVNKRGAILTPELAQKYAKTGGFDDVASYLKKNGFVQKTGTTLNKLELLAWNAFFAEANMQIVEEGTAGVGVGFALSDKAMTFAGKKLKLFAKGVYGPLRPLYTTGKTGVAFVPGTEVGNLFQAAYDDLTNNKDFNTYLEESYGDLDEAEKRFVVSMITGSAFGLGRLSSPNEGLYGMSTKSIKNRMSDILKKSENDLTKMSETDFNLYQLYAQQIKIRQDVQTYKSNIATENYWTSKIEKFKKNENIKFDYKFIRDPKDKKPAVLKVLEDGTQVFELNTILLKDGMIPHELFHPVADSKLKNPEFFVGFRNNINKSINESLKEGGIDVDLMNLIKEKYGADKTDAYLANEYFGNLLEIFSTKEFEPLLIQGGLLSKLKRSFSDFAKDVLQFDINSNLYKTLQKEAFTFNNIQDMYNFVQYISKKGKKGLAMSSSLKLAEKYNFEGDNLVNKSTGKIEYNAIDAATLLKLEKESKTVQSAYESWNKKDFPLDIIDPRGASESSKIITDYVTTWVKRRFGTDAEGNQRNLTQEQITELVQHTLFHNRGVYGILQSYKGGQPLTKTIKNHLDGQGFSRFMDIYKDSILAKTLQEGGETSTSFDPTYAETVNRIKFNSFKNAEGEKLNLDNVLTEASSIVDKILVTSSTKPEITFMDVAAGPYEISEATKPPMVLMKTIRNAFGKTTAERNKTIKNNLENLYDMLFDSWDPKAEESTQIVKGQSILKEFYNFSNKRRGGKTNQPYISEKKEIRNEEGEITAEGRQILDRLGQILTEGRVDAKHNRFFNVLAQAIQARVATDKLVKIQKEGTQDLDPKVANAAYISSIYNSIGNIKSVQAKRFASVDIVKELQSRGLNTSTDALVWLNNYYVTPVDKRKAEDIKLVNDIVVANAPELVKSGEGFSSKVKNAFGNKYDTDWSAAFTSKPEKFLDKKGKTIEDSPIAQERYANQLELQRLHTDNFTLPLANYIPIEFVNAANNVKTKLLSYRMDYGSERLAGNVGGKNGLKFLEALNNPNSKIKITNPEHIKIIEEAITALNSGKIEFAIKGDFGKKADAIIEKFSNDPAKVVSEINKLYPPEILKNLEKFDKAMGVFYTEYLNASKNPAERLQREKHLKDHFQMQSNNGWSFRAIAGFTSVFIPPPGYTGPIGKNYFKGEHMKSSSDFAFESWRDLVEGNYLKNYDLRKTNFEQSYGPEALWSKVDGYGKNNPQGYDRFFADHTLLSNTYDLATGRSMYEIYAAKNFVKEVTKVQSVNELRLQEIKQRNDVAAEFASKDLSGELNQMLEVTFGADKAPAKAVISAGKAERRGLENKSWKLFSSKASDAELLIYRNLTKGKEGEKQFAWWKENLLKPFAKADHAFNVKRLNISQDIKAILKSNKTIQKELGNVNELGYTNLEALRVYMWTRQGEKIPGLTVTDQKALVDYIEGKPDYVKMANSMSLATKGYGWGKPGENWLKRNLEGDIQYIMQNTARPEIFRQFIENKNVIFSPENLNKLEYLHGKNYREAWENMLYRMTTGRTRKEGMGRLESGVVDYMIGGTSAIMFYNVKSAVTQLVSMPNYINWGDNNIFNATKAMANIPQFAKDVNTLFNSDFAVARRKGLQLNINEAELAEILSKKGGFQGLINKFLKAGYGPTRTADAIAISVGGASMYRNRINKYIKEGLSAKEAESKAMEDWIELTNENQQSSRADRISYQQASTMGKLVLAFANTPMQYNRIIARSGLDLINRRGNDVENLSKIAHYSVLQGGIFTALQQGVFALALNDPSEEDKNKKAINMLNSQLDTHLRGLGFGGAVTSMSKDVFIDLYKRAKGPKYNRKLADAAWEALNVSPPISAKYDKLKRSFQTLDYEMENMLKDPLSIDDPFYSATANFVEGTTNVPLNRVLMKLNNLQNFLDEEQEWYNRLFSLLGYNEYTLLIEEEKPRYDSTPSKGNIFKQQNIFKKDKIFKQQNIFK